MVAVTNTGLRLWPALFQYVIQSEMVNKRKSENHEIAYAICTGLSLGMVQIFIKTNTNLVTVELGRFSIFSIFSTENVFYFFTVWPFFMLILFSIVGWICTQITYSHGDISISVPLFAVIQSVVTLIVGYVVFGEQMALQKIAGTVTIVLGVVIVILSSTNEVEMETA